MTNENHTIPAATAACPGIAYGPVTTFSNPPPADGWLIDGSLVYKLDETGSMNAYEVDVTMARGSRKHDGPRVALAEHIRAVLAAATPAASVQAMWWALEKLAQSWDGVKWEEGNDIGATIRHDFAMYAKEFGAAVNQTNTKD